MATIAPVVVGITINYGQVLARLGLATVCGGILIQSAQRCPPHMILPAAVGMQRELDNHAAGLRTHTLVCVGACMFMITGAYGFSQFQTELGIRYHQITFPHNNIFFSPLVLEFKRQYRSSFFLIITYLVEMILLVLQRKLYRVSAFLAQVRP